MNGSGEEAVRSVVAGANEHERSTESVIAELAALAPIEYDRRREAAAGSLGVRVGTLDAEVEKRRPKAPTPAGDGGADLAEAWAVEAWPSSVNCVEVLDEIRETLTRHVILPPHAAEAVALWIAHTWFHDAADSSPILLLTSPEKRCGKTQLIAVLNRLVSKPLALSNISAAALFRAVEKWRPTLLIDEADTFAIENDELRGLLNSGHTRATARAIRTVGDDHEPRSFSTWAPKTIACIGKLRDTVTDRSIEICMKRKQRGEAIARMRGQNLTSLEISRRRAARWALDSLEGVRSIDPEIPYSLNDRAAADSWRPLLAIADHAGGEWPRLAREAAVALSGDDTLEADSARAMLLEDLRELFADLGPRLASKTITERLAIREERPWPEWKSGKPITPRQLASLLRPFGVKPRGLRIGEKPEKGYSREDLEDAFSRYLTPLDPLHGHNPCGTRVCGDFASVTAEAPLPIEKGRKPAPEAACDRVTDREAGSETWTG